MRRISGITRAVLICAVSSMQSIAQEEAGSAGRLSALVQDLDDQSWAVREQAMARIGDPESGFELDLFVGYLAREDLSPETRLRIQAAARALFSQTSKAGLGVGFGAARENGVEINTVVDDTDRFPAAGVLMPGDLIVGADGNAIADSDELRAMILSHQPGETLNTLIQRADQLLDLELPLGSYEFLRGAAPISPAIADRAMEIRLDRQGIAIAQNDQVGGQISTDDWLQAGYPDTDAQTDRAGAPVLERVWRIIRAGSVRDIFVGVGLRQPRIIEAWIDRNHAGESMNQYRRIELSQQIHSTRIRIKLLEDLIMVLETNAESDPDGSTKKRYSGTRDELRSLNQLLVTQTSELNDLDHQAVDQP